MVISRFVLWSCYAALFVIGISAALIGPAKDALTSSLGIAVERGGWLLSAQFAGATVGVIASGYLADRTDLRWVMGGAGLLAITGAVAFANATSLNVAMIAAFTLGTGAGAWGATPNVLLAKGDLEHRSSALNILNMMWGLGAAAGPQLYRLCESLAHWTYAYFAFAALVLILLPFVLRTPIRLARHGHGGTATALPAWHAFLPYAVIIFLYVGMENGFGGWLYTQFVLAGKSNAGTAVMAASLFWAGLTSGRALAAVVLRRVSDEHMLIAAAMIAATAACVIVLIPNVHMLALTAAFIAGMGCGPIFPTTFAVVAKRVPSVSGAMLSLLQAGGALGAMLLPAVQGYWGGGESGGFGFVVATGVVIAAIGVHLARSPARV